MLVKICCIAILVMCLKEIDAGVRVVRSPQDGLWDAIAGGAAVQPPSGPPPPSFYEKLPGYGKTTYGIPGPLSIGYGKGIVTKTETGLRFERSAQFGSSSSANAQAASGGFGPGQYGQPNFGVSGFGGSGRRFGGPGFGGGNPGFGNRPGSGANISISKSISISTGNGSAKSSAKSSSG